MAVDKQEAKVTLHWLNLSRSQSIVWLLEELKINFDIKVYHRDKKTLYAPPELEKVHPLGKSPAVVITPPGENAEPIVLAESGAMANYLSEHFPEGRRLVPKKWKEGMEGKVGGETEAWLRNQYFLHYSEGSLMPYLLLSLVMSRLKQPPIPFFIRPITAFVANKIMASYVFPNIHKHIKFLDQQLSTSGGRYICCDHLTPADIILSFPLFSAKDSLDSLGQWEGGSWKKECPRVADYINHLQNEEGYKKSTQTIAKIDGPNAGAAPKM